MTQAPNCNHDVGDIVRIKTPEEFAALEEGYLEGYIPEWISTMPGQTVTVTKVLDEDIGYYECLLANGITSTFYDYDVHEVVKGAQRGWFEPSASGKTLDENIQDIKQGKSPTVAEIVAVTSWLDLSDDDWDITPECVQIKLVAAFYETYPEEK